MDMRLHRSIKCIQEDFILHLVHLDGCLCHSAMTQKCKKSKNGQKCPMDFLELSQWQDTFSDLRKNGAKWEPEQFVTLTIFQRFENINFSSAYMDVF